MLVGRNPHTTVRYLLICVAAALGVSGLAACDAQPGGSAEPSSQNRQVTVVGNGEVQGTPDTLTADVTMEAVAPDVNGAMDQTSQRQNAVIDALVDAGVDRSDVSTTDVSVQPQMGGPDNAAIVGYRARNTVEVKIRDLDSAPQTLALIVATGGDATRINSVNYSIEDDSQMVRDARARAFDDARDRAQQYAQLSGLELGQVISISEVPGERPPMPLGAGRAEVAAVPLEPGEQTIGFTVTAIWELG